MATYAHVQPLKTHKKQMVTVARDLRYGEEVIAAIKSATSVQQITNILNRARRNGMDRDRKIMSRIQANKQGGMS